MLFRSTAAFVSAGLLVIAIAVILLRLPAKAEAVAWAGSGPHAIPDGDAAAQVHSVDEAGNELADGVATPAEQTTSATVGLAADAVHGDADVAEPAAGPAPAGRHALDEVAPVNGTPRKHGPVGRHAAIEDIDDDAVPAGAGEPTSRA